jgi:hypothetical protein
MAASTMSFICLADIDPGVFCCTRISYVGSVIIFEANTWFVFDGITIISCSAFLGVSFFAIFFVFGFG